MFTNDDYKFNVCDALAAPPSQLRPLRLPAVGSAAAAPCGFSRHRDNSSTPRRLPVRVAEVETNRQITN